MHPSLTAQQQSELEMRLQRWGLVIALAVTCLLFAVPAFSAAPDYADYKQAHQSFGSFLKAVQDLLAAVLAPGSNASAFIEAFFVFGVVFKLVTVVAGNRENTGVGYSNFADEYDL